MRLLVSLILESFQPPEKAVLAYPTAGAVFCDTSKWGNADALSEDSPPIHSLVGT
jgi:hypothetical protein